MRKRTARKNPIKRPLDKITTDTTALCLQTQQRHTSRQGQRVVSKLHETHQNTTSRKVDTTDFDSQAK